MASTKNKSEKTSSETTSGTASGETNVEDVLRPFQDASARFLQASIAAQEDAVRQQAHAYLNFQDEVRRVHHEAYQAIFDITRKYLDAAAGQQQQAGEGNPEELYFRRAQTQFDYEREVRQVYLDTEARLRDIAQRTAGGGGGDEEQGGNAVRQFASQRQDAYQTYLAELQQAWSGTQNLDPQTINAIASSIMFTINAAGHAR